MQHLTIQRKKRFLKHLLLVPFILLPLPFILLLDLVMEIYHNVGFALCEMKKVKRSEYILVRDRNKLKYLTPMQKLFCMYCGYGNGLFRYLKEIAGRTEKHWCGIMHANTPGFKVQEDQTERDYSKFGDAEDFKKKYSADLK